MCNYNLGRFSVCTIYYCLLRRIFLISTLFLSCKWLMKCLLSVFELILIQLFLANILCYFLFDLNAYLGQMLYKLNSSLRRKVYPLQFTFIFLADISIICLSYRLSFPQRIPNSAEYVHNTFSSSFLPKVPQQKSTALNDLNILFIYF